MTDPFTILGVEPGFELDLSELERRHRELSRALHPDRHVGRPSSERRQALNRAIEVNDAWRALKSPVKRAEALLRKLELDVAEGREPKPDPSLLMSMMEHREELADARRSGDAVRVRRLAEAAMRERDQVLASLSAAFSEVLSAPADAAGTRERLLRRVGELRYYERLLDEVSAIEDEL
jgi:molecular chaperone HscB